MPHENRHIDTTVVRGTRSLRDGGPVVHPIYQTATFAAANFELQEELRHTDRFYTRYGNPGFTDVEATIAALEGAEGALIFGSGMAAISTALLTLLGAGDHLILQRDLYSGTYEFAAQLLPRLGIQSTFVDATRLEEVEAALRPNTRVLYLESPANPLLRVMDLTRLGALAAERGLVTIIDNTFATPINQRPIDLGIDIVVHSATKYMAGHSDIVCGALATSAELVKEAYKVRRDLGGISDPHAAFLLARGLRTLSLRVERQNASALRIAQHLSAHPRVRAVNYPFLESHPQYGLARAQMSGGGGMVSFEIDGTLDETRRCVESLRLFTLAGSLGGVESLVTLPALTTHAILSPAERASMGLADSLVRLSVGIEHCDDLIADLTMALSHVGAPVAHKQ